MRLFTGRCLAMAMAAVCLAAGTVAAPASADFSPPFDQQCSGSSVIGGGSSTGELFWRAGAGDFAASSAPEACPALQATDVVYAGSSSGAGHAAFRGARDPSVRFVGTTEAPAQVETALLEEGKLLTANDDAELRTIPQFVASVAVIVNFPEGCEIPEESAIGEGTTQRFQVSNASLEAAFAGDASVDTWGELLPGIGGEGCAAKPLMRVVRDERAGATFAVKRWLHTVNGERNWKILSNPLLNTVWPNSKVNLVRATDSSTSGNVNEATTVKAIDGSIGYAGLDAARALGFSEAEEDDDNNYWIPLHNAAGELWGPSLFGTASGLPGANCEETTFTGVPTGQDPTLESWREVSGAETELAYPLCTLVYALAWDDSADAYGVTESEQARQRMVRDFLGFQLSKNGQLGASAADQAPLPTQVLEAARSGQQQLGWVK
jgi:ABC-type phosphate transport system substrate-binding protein